MREAVALAPFLLAGSFCAALGQVALKLGAAGRVGLLDFVNPWIAAGLASYALGTALWIYSLSRAEMTIVYAFTALTFVLVYLAGYFLLGEKVEPRGLAGVGLVLAGLGLIMSQKV